MSGLANRDDDLLAGEGVAADAPPAEASSTGLPRDRPSVAGSRSSVAGGYADTRRKRIAIGAVAALVVILLALLGFRSCSQDDGFSLDPNAVQGQAPYKTAEEMQAELNRVVEEGMFNISIATEIVFTDGSSPGTAYIENIPGNRYDMQVSIALDVTGEEVYVSGAIAPGSYLGDITLSQDPGPGEHAATATFVALDQETHEEAGRAAARVTLVVEG